MLGLARPRIAWIAIAAVLVGGRTAHVAPAVGSIQDAANTKTVWDGVYSEAQADRGKERFLKECSACHMPDLTGRDLAPALNGEAFMLQWDNRTLEDLVASIRTTMPQGTPGQLTSQAYLDIVAFLLQANAFPAGNEELARDADLLKTIKILKQK